MEEEEVPGHEGQRRAGLGLPILDLLLSSVGESGDGMASQPVSGNKQTKISLVPLSVGRIIQSIINQYKAVHQGRKICVGRWDLAWREGWDWVDAGKGRRVLAVGVGKVEVGGDKCCLHREGGGGWPGGWGPYLRCLK